MDLFLWPFPHEELKCCETAALSRIKLVLSKAHFILTTASGCIDAAMKAGLGIFFSLSCRSKIFHHGKHLCVRGRLEHFYLHFLNGRKIWLFHEMASNDVMIDAL